MFELIIVLILYLVMILVWRWSYNANKRRILKYRVRIHVNGIRGKSTVVRLLASILREANYRTIAKTTGSAAVVIDFNGDDNPIQRTGPVNVKEQKEIIKEWEKLDPNAMVMECMALHPKYQAWSERMIIQAHIGVITNVREDHQDVMGETLPEIAHSLAQMCPENGYLVTAENNPVLLKILEDESSRRHSKLIKVTPELVSDTELSGFSYLSYKENVAIGLAVADLLGIDRETAFKGMYKAKSDIGVVNYEQLSIMNKNLTWANLFAVNDRESMIINMNRIDSLCDEKTVKIGILNNRLDRERRAEQFGEVAAKDLHFDWLITFGAYEKLVRRKLIKNGFPGERIVNLGFETNPSIESIIGVILGMIPDGHRGMLVGFVNIHTPQAEMLMDYFKVLPEKQLDNELLPKGGIA